MDKRTLVVVHVMPHEILMFKRFMQSYRAAIQYCKHDVTIRATLNLNPALIDWSSCGVAIDYFIDAFNAEFAYSGMRFVNEVIIDNSIGGTSEQKRKIIRGGMYDQYVFVDPDIVFHDLQLVYLLEAAKDLRGMYMISPNVPKFWDNTWDVLVHKDLQNVGLHSTEAVNGVKAQKIDTVKLQALNVFKFGCGLFNLFSNEFWQFIDIPDSIGGYGPEDTIAAVRATYAARLGYEIRQYLLDGIYVTESRPDEFDLDLLGKIKYVTDKDMLAKRGKSLIEYELINFVEKIRKK